MNGRLFVIVLLVTAIVALAPLAQSSPPDPTWLGGLWDDDDYDNVVSAVTMSVAALTLCPFDTSQHLEATGAFVRSIDERNPEIASRSLRHTRAPPAS